MVGKTNMEEKPAPVHVEEAVGRHELSEEEQPPMNFQTIMACIVCSPEILVTMLRIEVLSY
jgi:hypothetical protein